MTENEAKDKLDSLHYAILNCSFNQVVSESEMEALCMAKDTLSEIQQYRAIGTVEQLEWCKDASHWKELFKEKLEKYEAIGTIEEFKALKEKNNEHYSDTDELDGYGYTCTNKTCVERIRNKAIDEFAELMKEKLKDMQFAEFQGIDVCPCAKTGEECPYINQDIGCQYCAREQTIKEIDDIAEQMKAGVKNE